MSVADRTVGAFIEEVAAGSAPPGGGSAAAVAGALGAALCEMVCANTIARDDDVDVTAELAEAGAELEARRTRLLALADEDAAAIDELMAAYGTPDAEGRDEAIQAATKRAAEVPVEVAEACLDVLELATVVTAEGNPNAVPDGVIGTYLAHGALGASVYTVEVNLDAIEDEAVVAAVRDRVSQVERSADAAFRAVRATVNGGR